MSTNREIRRAISDYQTARGFSFIYFIYASLFAILPVFPFTFLFPHHWFLFALWLIFTAIILGAMMTFPKLAVGVAIIATLFIGYYMTWDTFMEKGFSEAFPYFLAICVVSFMVHRLAIIDLESNS